MKYVLRWGAFAIASALVLLALIANINVSSVSYAKLEAEKRASWQAHELRVKCIEAKQDPVKCARLGED